MPEEAPSTKEKRLARANRKLRTENSRLRRQVSRLKKQVDQEVALRDDEDQDPTPAEAAPDQRCCGKCGSYDLGSYTTPRGKVVVGCRACKKWRG